MKKNVAFKDVNFTKMKEQVSTLLGERFKIAYRFTDDIPRLAIGKAQLVRQDLDITKYLSRQES